VKRIVDDVHNGDINGAGAGVGVGVGVVVGVSDVVVDDADVVADVFVVVVVVVVVDVVECNKGGVNVTSSDVTKPPVSVAPLTAATSCKPARCCALKPGLLQVEWSRVECVE
jgi:hypothetical protein